MSGFIGAAQPVNSPLVGNDLRHLSVEWIEVGEWSRQVLNVFVGAENYRNEFWPTRCGFIGDGNVDVAMLHEQQARALVNPAAGSVSAFGFAGITRDEYGSAVPNVTVKLFRTLDDVLIDTRVSDGNGAFTMYTAYYPDTHYITIHKTGSPDLDGISANTLIGS